MKQSKSSLWLARQIVLLLGLTATLALSVLVWLLATDVGTRTAAALLQRALPPLTLQGVHGNPLRGLEVDHLRWREQSLDLDLDSLRLELNSPRLLARELGISQLHIAQLTLTHHSSDEVIAAAPIRLPRLRLPLTLNLDELNIEQLSLHLDQQSLDLEALRLKLRWQGERVHLHDLQLGILDSQIQARGHIALRHYYPLRLHFQIAHETLQLDGHFSGDLALLHGQLQSEGIAEASADFTIQPLSAHLLTRASLQLQTPLPTPMGTLEQLTLHANGELLGELNARLSARLDPGVETSSEPLTLTARARYREQALTLEPLHVQHQGQQLHARCHWPDLPEGQLSCDGELALENLQPWLAEDSLQLLANWQLLLTVTDHPELELSLATRKGHWHSHPLAVSLQLQASPGSMHLEPSKLQLGDNLLQLQGRLARQHNTLAATLHAAELAQLHPNLQGRIDGELQLTGVLERLDARGQLSGSELAWADASLGILQADLELNQAMHEASHLTLETTGPHALHLKLQGQRERHRLNLQAMLDQLGTLDLACHGSWQAGSPGHQLLSCGQLELQGLEDWAALQWALAEPLTLNWQPSRGELELAPFCLQDKEAASLCLSQPLTWRGDRPGPIQLELNGWGLSWLNPLLPEGWAATQASRLDGKLRLTALQPLELSAELVATPVGLHRVNPERSSALRYEQIQASLQVSEDALNAILTAHSEALGKLTARIDVAGLQQDRELQGQLELKQLELTSLAWLLPATDTLSGQLQGSVQLTGSTRTPLVDGQLALHNGRVTLPMLPQPLELELRSHFDAHRGRLDGHFRSGTGQGSIDGTLSWPDAGAPRLVAHLEARDLTLTPLPDSQLIVHPRLQLQWNAEDRPGLGLTGELPVEQARIVIGELPASAVQSSVDAVLVNEAGGEPGFEEVDSLPLWTRLAVDLGEDFQFQGFGANAQLAGQLGLEWVRGTPPKAQGELTLPQGRYRAYGQRLTVRQGSLLFDGDLRSPDLDLEVTRDLQRRDVIVGLRITGTPQQPHAQLFSDPAMPETSMAYYLLTGQPPPSGTPSGEFSGEGMLLSLGLAGAESPAAQLAERLGIHDLQLGTTAGEHGTEAQISASLGSRLHVRYGVSLEQDASSLTVQYQLTPKLFLEAVSGLDSALDLIYTFERQRRKATAVERQNESP